MTPEKHSLLADCMCVALNAIRRRVVLGYGDRLANNALAGRSMESPEVAQLYDRLVEKAGFDAARGMELSVTTVGDVRRIMACYVRRGYAVLALWRLGSDSGHVVSLLPPSSGRRAGYLAEYMTRSPETGGLGRYMIRSANDLITKYLAPANGHPNVYVYPPRKK